ncbi:protein kinase domain-containing protein [Planctomyces sp. SH-PL14]|uniref:protein kinase domain-containing protein n=1 Tax=Planctomyces sp. SH-PL14 TaxID=1632864 RepID=UPI00078EBDED|nr:protein kinase [Planctomyces sp. SH-PL14]AMV22504.1 Serine/threonine-protein kinase PrkC [Planctomyces sp. SH-PL14]
MDFRTLHTLVENSVWRIWRGEDPQSRQRFLIKELTDDARANPSHQKRLEQEVEFLRAVEHPRILPVRHADPGQGLLIFDDSQCTIKQFVDKHGPLSNDMVARVLLECVEGLESLHARGYVHGRINAQTVFVDPGGETRLGDFLGYRYETGYPSAEMWRQVRYEAPEIIDNRFGRPSPVSDLYCLGFFALEMIAGTNFPKLFGLSADEQERGRRWLVWHANEQAELEDWASKVPDVATSLADVVSGLIVKTPARRRFQTARDLGNHLRQLGLHSRRVLPPFAPEASAKTAPADAIPVRRVPPALHLTERRPPSRSFRYESDGMVLVSRVEQASLPIQDPDIGTRHALLACQFLDWHVYDLFHPSGTFLNGRKVEGPQRVVRGDELRFGKHSFLVNLEFEGTGIIPRFDLLKRLHHGRGGDLYVARWMRKSGETKKVALRIFPAEFQDQNDQIRRFLRAIPEAGRIKHKNVVQMYRGGMTRRSGMTIWFLASEFLPNGSLRDRIARTKGPLPLDMVRQAGLDIAQALQASAEQQILHRNVNPSCILFDGDEQAKLGDFVLSRGEVMETLYDITRGRLDMGEYQYQAPEVLQGAGNLTPACDTYGLAACLFEAITGKRPFDGQNQVEILTKASQANWPRPSELNPAIPTDWNPFMAKALARAPQDRFQTGREFAAQLERLMV